MLDWPRLIPVIGPANAALARFDGLIDAIPNADVLLSPLTTQEAVLSSRIEGTDVAMTEVLEIEAEANCNADQPKRDDAEEALNYRMALRFSADACRATAFSPPSTRSPCSLAAGGARTRQEPRLIPR